MLCMLTCGLYYTCAGDQWRTLSVEQTFSLQPRPSSFACRCVALALRRSKALSQGNNYCLSLSPPVA